MLKTLREQLRKLLEQRATLVAERDAIVAAVEQRGDTKLTADEDKTFEAKRAAIRELDDKEINPLETRIKDLEEDEKRQANADRILAEAGQTGQRGQGGAVVSSEPMTYSRHSGNSYFHDLARAQFRSDHNAADRLAKHAAELRVEMPARERRREQRARTQMDDLASTERWRDEQRSNAFETRVNPNRTDGTGGFLEMAAAAA